MGKPVGPLDATELGPYWNDTGTTALRQAGVPGPMGAFQIGRAHV